MTFITPEHRTFIFNAKPLNDFIARMLSNYIGPGSFYNNYSEIIRLSIESALYPYTDFPLDLIYNEIQSYQVSREVAQDLYANLTIFTTRMVVEPLRPRLGIHEFEVHVSPDSFIYIDDMGPIKDGRDFNLEDQFQEKILRDIENGDWVCPKMRRLAGW